MSDRLTLTKLLHSQAQNRAAARAGTFPMLPSGWLHWKDEGPESKRKKSKKKKRKKKSVR